MRKEDGEIPPLFLTITESVIELCLNERVSALNLMGGRW